MLNKQGPGKIDRKQGIKVSYKKLLIVIGLIFLAAFYWVSSLDIFTFPEEIKKGPAIIMAMSALLFYFGGGVAMFHSEYKKYGISAMILGFLFFLLLLLCK